MQDQERELLQRGFGTLQELEKERVAVLLQAGQSLAASYSSAVEGMPAAAAALEQMLGGLGDAGEAGVQHLAKVAAGERALLDVIGATAVVEGTAVFHDGLWPWDVPHASACSCCCCKRASEWSQRDYHVCNSCSGYIRCTRSCWRRVDCAERCVLVLRASRKP